MNPGNEYAEAVTSAWTKIKGTSNGETTNDAPSKIETGAIKYDAGKPAVWQGTVKYFPEAIKAVASVSQFGAQKYQWSGWRSVIDGPNRYSDALMRHLLYHGAGEEIAEDSKLPHLAHVAWNALAILELYLVEQKTSKVPSAS